MKKYFKLLAKKSLSLFMAVIMLMTCWVWVAPEKAEAANQHDGYYYVEVRAKLDDWDDDANVRRNNWIITHALGTTTLTSTSINNGSQNDLTGNYVHAYGWVPAFPTDIKHEFGQNYTEGSCGSKNYKGDGWGVRNAAVWVGDGTTMIQISESGGGYKTTKEEGSYSGTQITNFYAAADVAPYAASVKTTAGLEKKEISVPNLGATNNGSVSFTKAGVYNQYGVKMSDVTEYAFYADNAGTGAEYKKDDHGIWVSGTTAYASEKAQTGILNSSGSQKVYLFAKHGEIKGCIAEITLKYPSYTLTVNPVGSVTASGFNPTIILNSGSQTGTWTHSGPYGSAAATYPNGEATATGYTFKGFWTVKQPTTGDAGINASEATFATPVNQATFDTYKAQEGAIVDGSYVTLDGKKYYNAGTQWEAATHRGILGDNTFYGWWIPKDIVVKFYDIDGAYLGTQNAKYGQTPEKGWYPNPKNENKYIAGAMTYEKFAEKWRDTNTGTIITEGSYTFGPHAELNLTPVYTTKTYKDKYQVNFIDSTNGGNLTAYSKEYTYRDILEGTEIPTGIAVPNTLANDPGYTYRFAGWTSLKPSSGNYHTLAEGDTRITENTDWVVREDITYYAVFRSTVKEYLVAFNYIDSTGANKTELLTVPYGSALATPSVVNRTYATGGYGYTLAGWTYKNGSNASATLDADATLVFDNTKVFVTTNNLAPNGTAIVFTAAYGEGQPTPYTVTFKYKDATGKDKVITDEVYHGNAITQDTVDRVTVPAQYDDGTALYTFSNLWKVTEGTADKAEYTKDEFTSFKPVSHVTFEALYGEGVPFYTVTYIDGANKYEERVLAGKNVPAWLVDGEEYVPAKADTETGEYTFAGWFDAAQTDKDFAETNGKEYTLSDTVNADITLYSQFIFSPFTFTVKFVDYDGSVLAEDKFEAGESFKAIYDEAEAKASKPADDTYSYTFVGWDNNPGNYLCPNGDITFKAEYRPAYIYYTARWYNDFASMDGAVTEMEVVGQDGLLAKTSHTYEGAVYAPSVSFNLPTAPAGKVALFAGWKYLKDGVETDYVRGMQITAGMSFYATYKFVDAEKKTYTITTVVTGQENETYTIVEGDTAANIPNPANGYVDEDYHRNFVAWYKDAEYTTAFALDTEITENITIYAKFEQEEHSKTMAEFVSAPTYYAMGTEYLWCACDKEATIIRDDEGKPAPQETIPMLTDTVAPTGTIYLGTQGSWTSSETDPDKTGAGDTNVYYANADTDIVLTINDAGDVGPYNTNGVGKGIATIQGIISTGVFGADTTEIAGIQTILSDNSEAQNNTANYVIRLGTYEGLVDGIEYIAYYYAKDKAGNVLNKNVRTAKFIYDTTAPEIEISGDINDQTDTETYAEYCGKATIKGIENGATLTINGEAVTLTSSGANGKANHTIKEAGNYLIKVTDKAGNTTTKKIKITDGHDEVTTSQDVTCIDDGYVKVTCAACGKVISNVETKSEGHKYGTAVTVAPTCTDEGYDVATCSVCGDEQKTNEVPATGHKHEGWTVITAATCKTAGKKISNCSVCGKDTLTETIAIDENAHVYGAKKVLKATCTEPGEVYQNCKYCFKKNVVETLDALNHKDTGRYTKVTTAPTCAKEGVETTYCKACNEEMGTAPVAKVAHTLVLVKHEAENYMQYECQICGYAEGRTDIAVKAEYTVTFKDADGNVITTITKTEGESIAADAVTDQEKAQDDVYAYTFAGWKNSSDKVVKLPVKVTKNETYTAEFTATKRIYTHIFKLDKDDQAAYATIIGTYGQENKKPATNPTKSAEGSVTYEFAGWSQEGAAEANFTMTGDATFVAKFTPKTTKYKVTFINGTDLVMSAEVDGGTAYTAVPGEDKTPSKAYDKNSHYEFAGWYYESGEEYKGITNVNADTQIFAKFTAVDHVYGEEITVVEPATCTTAGKGKVVCSCGREKETTISKLGHNYELQADGSKVCSRCDDKIEAAAEKFTITFMDGETVLKEAKVEEGKDCTFTAPEKAATDEFEYTFVKWTDAKGNEVVATAEITVTEVTEDAVYYAVYTATKREYKVIYADADNNVLATYKIQYKGDLPAAPAVPAKEHNENDHFIFSHWYDRESGMVIDEEANIKVTGEMYIRPEYTAVEHNWVKVSSAGATCTEPSKTYYECNYENCDAISSKASTDRPLGHNYIEIDSKKADYGVEGYIKYECQNENCPEKLKEEKIPALTYKKITVTVKDGDEAVYGAQVTLYTADGEQIVQFTNKDGVTVFEGLKDGDYTVGYEGQSQKLKVKADKTVDFNIGSTDTGSDSGSSDCSCSCHKNGFWGMVFRFFHKVISWITGRIGCCTCLDERYK